MLASPLHARSIASMGSLFQTTVGRLRVVGFLEGVSFLLLLGMAMPLKYFAGEPGAVRVVGTAHGILFLLYVLFAIQATVEYRWTWKTAAALMLAALLPFGPFIADAKLLRQVSPEEDPNAAAGPAVDRD